MKQQIIFASNNPGKIQEVKHYFATFAYDIIAQNDFNLPSVKETGQSFIENALLKARHAAQHCQAPVLADDSGLVVDALQGEPGLHSARYAGEPCSDKKNNQKLLEALQNTIHQQRNACFVCVMVYLRHPSDPIPLIAQGLWHGQILTSPQGEQGFGYDSLFFVPTYDCSAAELPLKIKNKISHRAQALTKMCQQLKKL